MAAKKDKVLIGVSSCLLGQKVRYDGGDKYNAWINEELSQQFEFKAFCPEAEAGLGVPRQASQLTQTLNGFRAWGISDPSLVPTDKLIEYSEQQRPDLLFLSGFIFKSGSPSCGLAVEVFNQQGELLEKTAQGLFSQVVMEMFRELPVIEESQLEADMAREQFIEKVLKYHQLNFTA